MLLEPLGSAHELHWGISLGRPAQGGTPRRAVPVPARGPRTFRLRDVDEAAEDLAHARLQGEVLGASGHGNDKVGRFQVPVLGQQLIEGLRVRVAGQPDILRGRGKAAGSAHLSPQPPAPVGRGEAAKGARRGSVRKALGWGGGVPRGWGRHRGPPGPAGEPGNLSHKLWGACEASEAEHVGFTC